MRGRGGKIKDGRGARVSKEERNGWETGNPRRRAQKRSNTTDGGGKQINVIRSGSFQRPDKGSSVHCLLTRPASTLLMSSHTFR